jgi:hypothetical protein
LQQLHAVRLTTRSCGIGVSTANQAGSNDFRSSLAKVIYAHHMLAPFEFDIHRGWWPSAL